jgi:hypothetical protein
MRVMLAAMAACVLALPAAPAAADEWTPTSHCGWTLTNKPGTTEIVLVLVAEAHATAVQPAVTVNVTCTVENRFRETLTATGSMVGNDVYAVSSRLMTLAPPSYCVSSTAHYVDLATLGTFVVEEDEHCHDADW